MHCTNTNVYMYITFRKDLIVHVYPTFSLIVDCLKSSGKYFMHIQDAIVEFNHIKTLYSNEEVRGVLGLWCLTPLSTLYQLCIRGVENSKEAKL